jgi:putative GTP pyrophosphokinase
MTSMTPELLRIQYSDNVGRANRLCEAMVTQLSKLLEGEQIALAIPMESRVKDWSSIEEKLDRKSLNLEHINSLTDFVGIRVILLFRANLEAVDRLISSTFQVLESEDTAKRLGEAQFGYQSQHYVLKLPKEWLTLPSMTDLGELQAEVQVRTLAQHIWAAASHKLQYKHEDSVPPPLKRTINRVSALLEIVDLEFDRVLAEQKAYRDVGIAATTGSEPLNVDLLAALLNDTYPLKNRREGEPYEELLSDLRELSVNSVDDFKSILRKHHDKVMKEERKYVARHEATPDFSVTTKERINNGVFFAHVGLARNALTSEFGRKTQKIFYNRRLSRKTPKK